MNFAKINPYNHRNLRSSIRSKLDNHRTLQKFSTSLYLKYCALTGWTHVLPDYLIIGVTKCGTTSLYEYLSQHPDIYPPKGKEIDFFDRLYSRGLNWYKAGFPSTTRKFVTKSLMKRQFVTGEATPRYMDTPHTLQRIKNVLPNAKFIVLLRNPVDRAFSQYNMNLKNGYEYLTFQDAIKHERDRINGRYDNMRENENHYSWDYDLFAYVEHGVYYDLLKQWMTVFPKKQFMILQTEKFLQNPSAVYYQVLRFLNLPKWEPSEYKLFKKSKYKKSKMEPSLRKELIEYFRPYNEKLYNLLGTNFHWDE